MGEEPEESVVGGEEEIAQENSREVQLQSRALDSITDHVEDRQLDSRKVEQVCAGPPANSIISFKTWSFWDQVL